MINGFQLPRTIRAGVLYDCHYPLENLYCKDGSGGHRLVYVRVHAAGGADKGHHATGTEEFQFQAAAAGVTDGHCHSHVLQGLQPRRLQVRPADCGKSGRKAGKPAHAHSRPFTPAYTTHKLAEATRNVSTWVAARRCYLQVYRLA